ncbi:MAG: ferredoxin family protein [Desulfarculaceae bacterium]|jgi:NAD-dependent dihydropyrimidine dehydrogenase PreA subunit
MEPIDYAALEESAYTWIEIDHQRCNQCGICVDMCPMDVLRLGSKGYPVMRYRDDCWYCDVCVFLCPQKAVTMKDLPYLIR